jgi:hypothetical protein
MWCGSWCRRVLEQRVLIVTVGPLFIMRAVYPRHRMKLSRTFVDCSISHEKAS